MNMATHLFRRDAHDAHPLEEVQQHGLGKALQCKRTIDVFAIQVATARDEAFNARSLEALKLIIELRKSVSYRFMPTRQ